MSDAEWEEGSTWAEVGRARRLAAALNAAKHRDHVGWHVNTWGGRVLVDMTHGGPAMTLEEAEAAVAKEAARSHADAPGEPGPAGDAPPAPGAVPPHYDFAIEPDAAIEAWGLGFRLGNAVKYLARHGRKGDPIGDLKKAVDYIGREIARMEKEAAR